MEVIRKDATITNTDDTFPGSFQVILSTGTKDRDGEEVSPDEWELPLPEHITFDVDHGMNVASTVGSGTPRIDEDGRLIVDGTYSSLPRAQDVRTLVNEKHVRYTSVAFARSKTTKDGITSTRRELLNGAFVAIPANPEAAILASKGLKAGARNSGADLGHIQAIHDSAMALGAACADVPSDAPSVSKGLAVKTVAGSFEQTQRAVEDAVSAAYPENDDVWAYTLATFPDRVVYRVTGGTDAGQWAASYSTDEAGIVTLGTPERVSLVEQIIPAAKSMHRKAAETAGVLAGTVDASLDQASTLLASVERETLPAEVQQAIALVDAASASVDDLLDALGVSDPDEDAGSGATDAPAPATAKAATGTGTKAAPDEVTDSDVMDRIAHIRAAAFQ